MVYTVCLRNCGNPFDAEDLMQETFLAAYKSLDTFNREKEQAWICKIALNKCGSRGNVYGINEAGSKFDDHVFCLCWNLILDVC